MTAFFTDSWFRVASLRPRLARHLQVQRHRYGRQVWYVLHDPLAGRVHRLTPAAYLFAVRMDGEHTVDAIWQDLVAEMDVDAPGQEMVMQLLMQLHAADLLVGDVPPDAADLLSRRDRMARSVLTRNVRSPLSMQIPLLDPERLLESLLPLVRPLLGPVGILLWSALVGAGVAQAVQHWDELTQDVFDRVLAGEGLLALALCYPVIKILHELGHGLVAKRFGCEVREMGVMLLVLIPVPYVDVSSSAVLRSKWQRAAVAGAGIAVELGLAAAAALVWAAVEPGVLRAAAYNVMLIGGVSTLLINGNPLLRFDGYYVLSDVLAVPNLAQRGGQFLGHLVNRYVFAVQRMQDFPASVYEKAVMLAYAPLSWCYRMTMLFSIALFVATNYLAAGVAIAGVTVATGLVWPLVKKLGAVAAGPVYAGRRMRAAGLTFGGIALMLLAVLVVPVPVHGTVQGVVWLPQEAVIRAGADGFVRETVAAAGALVAPGATLFTLRHDLAEARMRVTEARVTELTAKSAAEYVTDRIAASVTGFELQQEEARLARERKRLSFHTVAAKTAGVFNPVRPADDMQGRFVKEGEVMGWVTPDAGQIVRVAVPQGEIGLVRDRLRGIQVRLADGITEVAAAMVRTVPEAADTLPSPALASANGGAISADMRDPQKPKAFERHFQLDVALPDGDAAAAAGFGSRVSVRFDYTWEPVAELLYRHVRQGLLRQFET